MLRMDVLLGYTFGMSSYQTYASPEEGPPLIESKRKEAVDI